MNIIEFPQDYKNFIYLFLKIKDLVNLGITCKTFHHNEQRKEMIKKKVIHTWFYTSTPMILSSFPNIFPNLLENYFDHLKKIKFSEYSLTTLEANLPFFVFDFLRLNDKDKESIIRNLVQYLFDIWKYWKFAQESFSKGLVTNQNIQLFRMGDTNFHYKQIPLFSTFEGILKSIFIEENENWRLVILNELSLFCNQTKTKERMFRRNRFSYNFSEPYRYTLDQFLCKLSLYYWRDLSIIISIADLLETFDEMYLYDFIYEIFQPFIDCQYLNSMDEDEYAELFVDQLSKKYHLSWDKTNKERLFELFTSCHYMVHQDLEFAIEFRIKRLEGMDEDDFDY